MATLSPSVQAKLEKPDQDIAQMPQKYYDELDRLAALPDPEEDLSCSD